MTAPLLKLLCSSQVSPHVTSETPAWVCTCEPPAVIWMNGAAARFAQAQSTADRHSALDPRSPLAIDLVKIAANLPDSAGQQLARIRGLSGSILSPTTCSCSRLAVQQGAILIVSAEHRRSAVLPLSDRVRTAPRAEPAMHKPLRFVWQIDAQGRFTIGSAELIELAGDATARLLGRGWAEIAAELHIDPDRTIESAIASRQAWTGLMIDWPIGDKRVPIPFELSGAPMLDGNRNWAGYRGFGLCRDIGRLSAIIAAKTTDQDFAGPHTAAKSRCDRTERTSSSGPPFVAAGADNELDASRSPEPAQIGPQLSAAEQSAFREIGEVLRANIPAGPRVCDALPARAAANEQLANALLRAQAEARELRAILDTATDGVIVIERDGRIVSLNRSAEALFGCDSGELLGQAFTELFAHESRRAALDYLDGLALNGVASVLNDGREVIGRVREGGLIPLFMTMGRIADGTDKFCAVLRDITQWKRAEEDLLNAKREAERASSAKSDFLAKISHEIRTPLNAIIGFSEVMLEERFGSIGNERYRQYLKDIHTSGGHLVSLLNDLLDLSKIEAGKLDLSFTRVDLTALLQQCVAIMQPQANRERIIIRTSLSPNLPGVVVDERSIRQIVLNLLSNSIKFTRAGGQVIMSTALTEHGEAVVRVRDTGVGMSEKDIETALEPFRQLATSTRWGSGGTGLGLPLTKALAEANRATFTIRSAVDAGTLVEITFPTTRVLAE